MSSLLDRLLGVFRKLRQAPALVSPQVLLTPENITERLKHRPTGHELRRAVPLPQPTPVRVVVEQPPTLRPEVEFAVADAPDVIEQPCDDEPYVKVDFHGDLDAQVPFEPVPEVSAPAITSEPEPIPVAAEDIPCADDEHEPIEAATIQQQSVRTAPEARPSAEILAEFHALMQHHFGREKPKAELAAPDVLKIIGLDRGELISSVPSTPLLMTLPPPDAEVTSPTSEFAVETPQADAVALEVGEAGIETPHGTEIIVETVVTADATQAVGKAIARPLWRNRAVGEVILQGECSVRLANCINGNRDFFFQWTIGEALDRRPEFTTALFQVWSLGRKTAKEALDAIDAFALDPKVLDDELSASAVEQISNDPLSAFDLARLNASISTALSSRHTSVRLGNLLATAALDDLTIRDFILQPDEVRKRMMDCKNAGRKTVTEAFELLAAHVKALGEPEAEAPSVRARDEPRPGLTTREWIEREMCALPANRVEVLHDRYGLDGKSPLTLQEIAERVHVTRERVRQVEAGAIKRLRTEAGSRAAFLRYLAEERDTQWVTLFGPHSTLPENEVAERFRSLDPWFLLAIDVVYADGTKGYLEANAHWTPTGWFMDSEDAEGRKKLDSLLGEFLATYKTPMPLDTLAEIAPAVTTLVTGEGDDWAVHDGYLFTGHVGSKARRTGRIHAVARRIARSGIFDIGTLIIEYRAAFPEDDCGSRIFEMQANEAPHLFAPLFDGIWLCLDHSSRHLDCLPAPPFEHRRLEETQFAAGSLGDLLIKHLYRFGPQRAIDLRRTIIDSNPGSFSESSVGAVLISNPCFRRAAPGIFGVYAGATEDTADIDAHLLEDRHCRLYCHARHSGAPQDYYPLWGSDYEMRLASWAERHAPHDLYRSLVSVIEPESWPAASKTIAEFQALRSRDGDWQIGAGRRLPLGHRFMDSGQFLSALTHLVVFGWLGWVAVNRATGSKPDNHDAADVLAFFVMTGLVEPETDWQAPHHPTDLARRLFLDARWERHLHGDESTGDEDVFGRLRSALYEAPPNASRGWVDIEEFTAAMAAWRDEGISNGKAFSGAQARRPGLNAEESFESDEWDSVFRG